MCGSPSFESGESFTETLPKFLRNVRSKGRKQRQERAESGERPRLQADKLVGKNHQLGDGGIESEGFYILARLFDRGVDDPQLLRRQLDLGKGWTHHPGAFLRLLHGQTPNASEKPIDAFNAFRAPGFRLFERTHEHFVEPQRIGAVVRDDVVGVDHIAAALRHFLIVRAEDESLG